MLMACVIVVPAGRPMLVNLESSIADRPLQVFELKLPAHLDLPRIKIDVELRNIAKPTDLLVQASHTALAGHPLHHDLVGLIRKTRRLPPK